MTISNIRTIARKEFYHLLRDYRSLCLAFAIPLLLILLFGHALSLDVEHVRTVVVDQDNTDLSRNFLRKLEASPSFRVLAHLSAASEATGYLDEGRAALAVLIPPGWTRKIRSEQPSPLQVLLDGSDPNFASISRSYISAFIEQFNRQLLRDFLNKHGKPSIQPPVEGRIRVWFNEDLESRNFIVPGIIAIIIMIVGAILTSLVIAREYENGTMETIKSLPITAGEFLLGKAIPYFGIALTDVLIAMLMGQILFGVIMKSSFWLMMFASSLYIAVALTLGLLISTTTRSQLVANQTAVLVTYLPSLLLSNFVFPVANMPQALQFVTKIVPATYYIKILSGIYLKNLGMANLWPSFLVLGAISLLLAALNCVMLKRAGL